MGIIIGKLRKKKTTYEVLETLDREIKNIEEYRRSTEQTHKRIVGRFIIISVIVYLVTALTFYFYYFPATFYDRLFYIIPLILAPVIILTVQRVLSVYYKWKIERKQNKLVTLRDEKKKMLEKVMETETYKVAKTILEKFAPETRKSTTEFLTPQRQLSGTPLVPPSVGVSGGLRQRALPAPAPPNQQLVPSATPARSLAGLPPIPNTMSKMMRPSSGAVMGTPLPMPRAILPRERSVLDRMVDYLVGDGPTNRYALICKNCFSHNGMAFREEFEYISFRCCYCFNFNPARKQRPAAPKLDFDLKSPQIQDSSDEENKSSSDSSDSEKEIETSVALKPTDSQDSIISTKVVEIAANDVPHQFQPVELDKPITAEESYESLRPLNESDTYIPPDGKRELLPPDAKEEFDVDEEEASGNNIIED